MRLLTLSLSVLLLALTGCTGQSSTPKQQFELSQDGAFAASVSHSGKYALVSTLYHGVSLWDMTTHGVKYHWDQAPSDKQLTFSDGSSSNSMSGYNFVFATAISFDDSHAVLADKENFSLWDMSSGENVGYWQVRKSKYRITETGETANVWPRRTPKTGLSQRIEDMELIDDNKCIAPDEQAGELCVIDGKIRAVDVSKDGKHILLGKSNGVAVHITVANGRRIEFLGHRSELLDENGEPTQINNAINSVALSPNGRYALTGASDHVAYLWDTKSGQVIYKFRHANRVTQVALDPKARYAFTSDSQKQARIWDLKTGKNISQLKFVNRQEVFSFARFSQDGKHLVTGAPTRKLSLWDVNTGQQTKEWLVTPRKDTRPASAVVYSAAFIENDTQILSLSSAGLGEVWELKND